MHLDNEYEKLLKEGYIEGGTLVISVDDLTKINLSTESLNNSGNGIRQDKSVVVIDKQGRIKRVSSIMLGYNKDNIQLADGSFVNADDLRDALTKAVTNLDRGTIVVNKKGKFLDVEGLLSVAKESAGKLIIGSKASKITNQDSRYWSVEGAESKKSSKKGIVFLGNNGIDLKSGDYISADEFLTALNEYMVMIPKKSQTEEELNEKFIRVTHKYKNQLSRWLIILAAVLTFASGFKYSNKYENAEYYKNYQEAIVETIEQDQLDYLISQIEHIPIYASPEESIKKLILNYKTGDMIETRDGDILYSNSLLNGNSLTIGNERKSGYYPISGISIVKDGNLLNWVEDFSLENTGVGLSDLVEETCNKYGVTYDELEIRVHLGDSKNYTRMGWIDISNLIGSEQIDQQIIDMTTKKSSTYEGIIEDFSGNKLTFKTLSGNVTLDIRNNDGKLIQSGTTVIGSDGKEYLIENLEEKIIQKEQEETKSNIVITNQEVNCGKQLTWSIMDCDLAVAISPLIGALAASLATKRKNKQAQENPMFFEFDSDKEYIKFKNDFEEAKKKYEQQSNFKKMIKRLFYQKEVDVLQNLTEEQISKIYSVIRNTHNSDYSYNANDNISIANGKIIVTFIDGRRQDITDIILPKISHIGQKNDIITEGLLEEGRENGFHKR